MPGPNAYNVGKSYEPGHKTQDSRKHNAPAYSFGSSPRRTGGVSSAGPGPGNYGSTTGAVGNQALSSKPNAPRAKFGTAPRSRIDRNAQTPAPNAYGGKGAFSRHSPLSAAVCTCPGA